MNVGRNLFGIYCVKNFRDLNCHAWLAEVIDFMHLCFITQRTPSNNNNGQDFYRKTQLIHAANTCSRSWPIYDHEEPVTTFKWGTRFKRIILIWTFVSDPLSCPEGWIGNDAALLADNNKLSCYFVNTNYALKYINSLNYTRNIEDYCKAKDSFAVAVNDKAENDFVRSMWVE